jgi:hypothetical protein
MNGRLPQVKIKTLNELTTMNQKLKNLAMIATVAGLSLAVSETLHAQTPAPVLEKVAFSLTTLKQGNSTTNRTTVKTATPAKKVETQTSLLSTLAQDASTTFPPGSALYFNGTGFEVDKGGAQIADVSSILTVSIGAPVLTAGNYSVSNGPAAQPYSETDYELITVAYNGSISGLSFSVTGVGSVTTTVPAANPHNNKFKQSGALSMQDGTGSGVTTEGSPFLLTGFTITASGSANETNTVSGN